MIVGFPFFPGFLSRSSFDQGLLNPRHSLRPIILSEAVRCQLDFRFSFRLGLNFLLSGVVHCAAIFQHARKRLNVLSTTLSSPQIKRWLPVSRRLAEKSARQGVRNMRLLHAPLLQTRACSWVGHSRVAAEPPDSNNLASL